MAPKKAPRFSLSLSLSPYHRFALCRCLAFSLSHSRTLTLFHASHSRSHEISHDTTTYEGHRHQRLDATHPHTQICFLFEQLPFLLFSQGKVTYRRQRASKKRNVQQSHVPRHVLCVPLWCFLLVCHSSHPSIALRGHALEEGTQILSLCKKGLDL